MATPKKVALVTGSTSGIGLATARALAKRGVDIIITGFGDEKSISSIVDDIKGHGVQADYVPADLSKVADIDSLWSEIINLHPDGVDILINCAGCGSNNFIEIMTDSQWNLQVDVLMTAPFHLIKRSLPSMKAKGWGRIVNISSVWGLLGSPTMSAYVAAKHGLIGLTKTVALESASDGITCNTVCPGAVKTPLLMNTIDDLAQCNGTTSEEVEKNIMKDVPTGKVIQPEEVAELIEFLCLSNASPHMTGATFVIDGGKTAK